MKNIVIGNEGKVSVSSKEAFKKYRLTAKLRDKNNTPTTRKYKTIVNAFYGKIAEKLVEGEAGVFLKNFGYLSIVANPKRQVVKVPYQEGKEYFNFNTNNQLFMPMFFAVAKFKPLLNFWVMDRAFSRKKVKANLHKKLISGKKYKTYIATLYSLYATKL